MRLSSAHERRSAPLLGLNTFAVKQAAMSAPHLHEIIDNLSLTYHLEHSSLGILLLNSEMELVYCSARAEAIFGWENGRSPLHKKFTLTGFVHPDDEAQVSAKLDEITSGKLQHNQSLNRNLAASGEVVFCQWYNSALKDAGGAVMNILSLMQDVTEQMQTNLLLQAHEQQLSVVFNSAIDPMWLIRCAGSSRFEFETINTAFTKVTGWTAEQVVGQPIEAIMPPTSHELVRDKYNEVIRSGNIVDYIEKADHPSGVKYGEIRVIPIRDDAGNVTRLLGIANDITDKILLQEKLDVEQENRSRQVTSAAIRGQEAERAKVSRELHDNVNQVLTTVKLFTELCIDGKADNAVVLPKCASLLNDCINEIRSLSKQLSAPSLGSMNFRESLKDLVTSIAHASEMEIRLHVGLEMCMEMDTELHLTLYRIVQEQLTNIMKHAKARTVSIELEEKDASMHLLIQDDGVGFDMSQKTGGIGLTNMRSRAVILGGSFEIYSQIAKGTRMMVRFPVTIIDDRCIPLEVPGTFPSGR
jgi:PAS domain S-box-containing protein